MALQMGPPPASPAQPTPRADAPVTTPVVDANPDLVARAQAAPPPVIPDVALPRAIVPPVVAAYDDTSIGDDPYAHSPPFRPRRNPARLWTTAALALIVVLAGIGGAIAWYGPGRVATLVGMPPSEFDVPLLIMPRTLEPTIKPNGTVLLPVAGRIVNPTDSAQPLLDILVEIRDQQGRVVYSWTIPRPAATIPARGSVPFESATVNPPRNAAKLKFVFIGAAR